MNKAQLTEQLATRFGGNKKAAGHALESVLDTITRIVAAGEKVAITRFGVFEKIERKARTARNPATGATVKVKKTAVPRFKPGSGFKSYVSGAVKLPKLVIQQPPTVAATPAPAAKSAAKKATTTRTTAKKAAPKKAAAKKGTAKKAATKKTTGTAAKKSTGRATTSRAATKTATSRTSATKRTTAKATTKRATPTAKRTAAKRTTAKATATRSTARKR